MVLKDLIKYKIGDRPEGLGHKKYKGKWDGLMELLSKIDATQTIQVTLTEMGYKDFNSLYNSLKTSARKKGMRIGVEEKDGIIHIFPR